MADENGVAVRSAAVLLIAASASVTPMHCVRTVKDVDPSLPVASPRPNPYLHLLERLPRSEKCYGWLGFGVVANCGGARRSFLLMLGQYWRKRFPPNFHPKSEA